MIPPPPSEADIISGGSLTVRPAQEFSGLGIALDKGIHEDFIASFEDEPFSLTSSKEWRLHSLRVRFWPSKSERRSIHIAPGQVFRQTDPGHPSDQTALPLLSGLKLGPRMDSCPALCRCSNTSVSRIQKPRGDAPAR